MNNDLVYLNRRASEERKAAFRSPNKHIADIHRELADAYDFRVFILTKMAALNGTDRIARGADPEERTGTCVIAEPTL